MEQLHQMTSWVRESLVQQGIDPFEDARGLRSVVDIAIDRYDGTISPENRRALAARVVNDVIGLGPLQQFLDDPAVEEIWINTPSRVFVARDGQPELTTVILEEGQVRDLVERMLLHSGRRLDISQPFVDAMMRGGERLHVVIPPVAGQHWSVNIRKHIQRARSLADLEHADMLSSPVARFLQAAVASGLSIMVSGATQAGKTTLLRALAGELPRTRRVISCEEVFELALGNRDHVALQTRSGNVEGAGVVTLRDLVRETLRMRPEVIIVGEVRGAEALDMLLALNSGIPGMATVHANNAHEALSKLTMLPLLAGENVTSDFVIPTVASSIDVVCHVERDIHGIRRVSHVLGLPGRVEGSRIETSVLWQFDGARYRRGSGAVDWHHRFAAAGYDLSALLRKEG